MSFLKRNGKETQNRKAQARAPVLFSPRKGPGTVRRMKNYDCCANFPRRCKLKKSMEGPMKHCDKCKQMRPDADFVGARGKPVATCRSCRDKRKEQVQELEARRAPQRAALASENGGKKMCSKCPGIFEIEAFLDKNGRLCKRCDRCRSQNRAGLKRLRDADPEKFRQYKNQQTKKARKAHPLRARRREYRKNAKQRGREITLSNEQMDAMFLAKCYYCDMQDPKGVCGIDRKRNEEGYTLDNCVPCCTSCNKAKGTFTVQQFLVQSKAVAAWHDGIAVTFPWPFEGYRRTDYDRCIHTAKARRLEFQLTRAEHGLIVANPCYLCGKRNEATHENGIDRVDNSKGYTITNCRACCYPCNRLKHTSDVEQFITKCRLIAAHSTT